MPRRPTIKPKHIPGRNQPWKIDLPARLSPNGKRQRFFFEIKTDADNFADGHKIRIQNFGVMGSGGLSPAQIDQAANAFLSLSPFEISLNEVVQDWITRRKALEKTIGFEDAFRRYEKHLTAKKIKKRPVSEAYRRQVKYTFPRFPRLHKKPLAEITPGMIIRECEGMPATAKNAFLRVLSAFFSWCIEEPNKWLVENPAQKVPRDDVGKTEVATFSPADSRALLSACVKHDIELLPYFTLGFFAGIRPEELQRMQWENIDLKESHIVLPSEITKTGMRRVIQIEETLSAWLKWHISKRGKQAGLVTPPKNLRSRLRDIRDKAKVTWIQDGMRHTYASNWLAIHKDEHQLRANLGHRSADELWDHYNKATTAREAEKFWAILPAKKPKNVLQFKKGAA